MWLTRCFTPHYVSSCSFNIWDKFFAWRVIKCFIIFLFTRYTIFDSKQMPPIAQPPSHAPLLMQQPQPLANVPSGSCSSMQNPLSPPQMDVLSVSSKKLCSYCTNELGSGAAMIIENLGLFYHIFCFKCSVCHIPISDGNIHGTDVRVRNSRLHCQNCFSNEEGVKFSCVWLIYVGLNERRSLALMITELRELIFSIQFFKCDFILKHMSPTSPRKQSDYFSLNFLLFDELLNQRRKNTRKAQHKKKKVSRGHAPIFLLLFEGEEFAEPRQSDQLMINDSISSKRSSSTVFAHFCLLMTMELFENKYPRKSSSPPPSQ